MTVISFKIPHNKLSKVSSYIRKAGGRILTDQSEVILEEQDNKVTHGVFFGENIKRLIKAFQK
jgi:hypothetical protein